MMARFGYAAGCLVWLIARAGGSWAFAWASAGVLVFGLRLSQVYLPGRSAEITDVVLLLIVAAIMKLMSEDLQQDDALE